MIIGGVCAAVTFAAMRALRLRGERWPSGPTTPLAPPTPLAIGPIRDPTCVTAAGACRHAPCGPCMAKGPRHVPPTA